MPVIGIDLGTTYSCVGVWQHGKVEIIANDLGNRTTPSYVAFTDEERLIGEAAKNQAAINPENTVFDVKRLIGRKFEDPNVQEDRKHWPFEVLEENSRPKIRVDFKGQKKDFFPEEISSMVLQKMKDTAEMYVGTEIKDAVITVPAYFNDSQKYATKQAGFIAGLNVMKIISEPTAAALAYGLEKNICDAKIVLVYDFGGGTLDVSILRISKKSLFDVLSTSGNTHLGGEDFDNRLVDYLAEECVKKFCREISINPKALQRLKSMAEQCKRMLSVQNEASVDISCSGFDFQVKVSRARFEDLCMDLFESTIASITNAIEGAKLNKNDIDDIVLVGGSSRIPKIRNMIQDYFDGKQLNFTLNPDEAIAYGATIHAAALSGDANNAVVDNIVLIDVTPLSLGIEELGDRLSVIIEKNSHIPCERTNIFETTISDQTAISILVYEGERLKASANQLLGEFDLTNIPRAPRGEIKIVVAFKLDENGILDVTATVLRTGKSKSITVTNKQGRLSKEMIDKMILNAARFKEQDQLHCQKMLARRSLESYAYEIKYALKKTGPVLSDSDKKLYNRESQRTLSWLNATRNAFKEEYDFKLTELKKLCSDFLDKMVLHNRDQKKS